MNEENPKELDIGQVWHDKHHKWAYGANDLDFVHVILSADYKKGSDIYYWTTAQFMWTTDGYCGAQIRKFTEDELRMMVCVGDIKDIINFSKKHSL